MKFGESLEEGLVPEWKDQYVNYGQGKKLVKKTRDAREALYSDTPNTDRTPLLEPQQNSTYGENDQFEPLSEPAMTDGQRNRGQRSLFSQKSTQAKQDNYNKSVRQFKEWLDHEIAKVDEFFVEKEQEAYKRYLILQDQLYQLREHQKISRKHDKKRSPLSKDMHSTLKWLNKIELPSLPSTQLLDKLLKREKSNEEYDANFRENLYRNGQISTDDEFSDEESTTPTDSHPVEIPVAQPTARDYVKRQRFGIPYAVAKRQLRQAVFEFYRSLTILRSYRVLNRTAIRKITKKFDKLNSTRICEDYMKLIDEKSYFQTSDLLDRLISHTEEMYIAFFEPHTVDRKHSLEKLKSMAFVMNAGDFRQPTYYSAMSWDFFMIGFAIPLIALGIYIGIAQTQSGKMREGKYLLQIWGGFFLLVLVFLYFGINFMVFDQYRINYKFIFEFDMSTALNWRQFLVIPSFAFALMGLIGWFSLNNYWPERFPGRDWPWLYWGIMVVIFFWPGKQMYASSRRWLQTALWRLLFSGFYPVEFRDFFLGDILCSLTYTMGNISFFFCVYATHWNGLLRPGEGYENQCGSNNSRLMGFFSTVPTIMRWMQCLRRFMDTGDWFPHFANMVKYSISMVYTILLSVWRIERTPTHRVVFIVFACINSIYSSAWDLMMDWSLLHAGSKNFLLRDHLFYPNHSVYYIAMVLDVVIRFQWVFYACFSNQVNQSAVTSFLIGVAEVTRRFIWVFFRMENEHSTNVVTFRASKESPLPYPVSHKVEKAIDKLVHLRSVQYASDHDLVQNQALVRCRTHVSSAETSASKRKSTLGYLTEKITKAHIKDFQRRRQTSYSDDDDDESVALLPSDSEHLPSL